MYVFFKYILWTNSCLVHTDVYMLKIPGALLCPKSCWCCVQVNDSTWRHLCKHQLLLLYQRLPLHVCKHISPNAKVVRLGKYIVCTCTSKFQCGISQHLHEYGHLHPLTCTGGCMWHLQLPEPGQHHWKQCDCHGHAILYDWNRIWNCTSVKQTF